MSEQVPDGAPFWKIALALWLASLAGAVLVLPYAFTLERAALVAAAERTHLTTTQLLLISTAQTAVLLSIAVVVGLWASRRLGLAVPLISAWLARRPLPQGTGRTLLVAFVAGLAVGIGLVLLDMLVFAQMSSVAGLVKSAGSGGGSAQPSAWQGLLASFYGGIDEEILLRLGLMSLLALALRAALRRRDAALPSSIFWTANILSAVLFGLGHLPATAALVPLTAAVVLRAIVLNGAAGLVFGVLFRRYGLEWAMLSHFAADLVLHVAA